MNVETSEQSGRGNAKQVELQRQAMAKIRSGDLPAEFDGNTRAGYGCGERCNICGAEIDKSTIEYEIEWPKKTGAPRIVRLHLDCFQAWIALSDRMDR